MLLSKFKVLALSGLIAVCCLVTICPGQAYSQSDDVDQTNWDDVQTAVYALVEQDNHDEALTLLKTSAPKLKDREFEVSDLTLEILFTAGRTDEAMTVWEDGLDDDYFYFVVPRMGIYDTVRKTDRYKKALAKNNRLRDKAHKKSKPEYKVITPESYDKKGSYPLVIVIHGGNQSIVKSMDRWDHEVLGADQLVAFVQSSWRVDTKSYRWDLSGMGIFNTPTAQDEVLGLYETIVKKYAVDTSRVTLAGFSQGGNLALIMAAEGTIPASGFIAGCPAMRSPISSDVAQAAAERGLRGTIFVGETDWTAASVQTTVDNFNEVGLSVNHLVMEGKGHEFPSNFDDVLRDALRHIHQ
jgi:predicted esterase